MDAAELRSLVAHHRRTRPDITEAQLAAELGEPSWRITNALRTLAPRPARELGLGRLASLMERAEAAGKSTTAADLAADAGVDVAAVEALLEQAEGARLVHRLGEAWAISPRGRGDSPWATVVAKARAAG